MGFSDAVRTCLKLKYATFSGRASRSEFWWFNLFITLIGIVLGGISILGIDFQTGQVTSLAYVLFAILGIFYLAILIPMLAVTIRRLHDRNMSGWWYLGFLVGGMIPFVGIAVSIAMLVIFCLKGTDGDNNFGADPLRQNNVADVFA